MEKEKEVFLGNNSIDDVSWLCSLSESELDLLITLKKIVIKRASVFGHAQLANKFDLKMLRALASVLMEHLKGKVKDSPLIPGFIESSAFLDCSDLLKSKVDDVMSIEELEECIAFKSRKEFCKRPPGKDVAVRGSKRLRLENLNEETESEQLKIMASDTVNVEETIHVNVMADEIDDQ